MLIATSDVDIWVTSGTYVPTSTGDFTISFEMREGVDIYGGFLGIETTLEQRDWQRNITVLSGDIMCDDIISENIYDAIKGNNSYNVVKGANNGRLDGFTISGGSALGISSNYYLSSGITRFLRQ